MYLWQLAIIILLIHLALFILSIVKRRQKNRSRPSLATNAVPWQPKTEASAHGLIYHTVLQCIFHLAAFPYVFSCFIAISPTNALLTTVELAKYRWISQYQRPPAKSIFNRILDRRQYTAQPLTIEIRQHHNYRYRIVGGNRRVDDDRRVPKRQRYLHSDDSDQWSYLLKWGIDSFIRKNAAFKFVSKIWISKREKQQHLYRPAKHQNRYLVPGLLGTLHDWPKVGIAGSIWHEHVDLTEMFHCLMYGVFLKLFQQLERPL